jgi:hypothetical protein
LIWNLRQANILQFVGNGKLQAFTRDNRIFCEARGQTSYANGKEYFWVELDQDGRFVFDDKKTPLKIEYGSLNSIQKEFILLNSSDAPWPETKFWLMSLDNFPTLVIDKGK